MRPSIKDVAKRSGTSIATVSNVLNKRCNVSDELTKRVMDAVAELNYSANPTAQNLKTRKSGVIGVIVTDMNCIFFPPMLKGICNILVEKEYTITLYDSRHNPEREVKFIELLKNSWADGIILDSVAANTNPQYFKDYMDEKEHVPMVCVENDMRSFGVDSVLVDNKAGARTAVTHLAGMGCKRIAHITGNEHAFVTTERLEGYYAALDDHGLERDKALVCKGNFSPQSGYDAIKSLLQSDIEFDGVFAANDQMAIGALHALNIAGKAVPEDVKVVGYDNTFVASIVKPALTTISVPAFQVGTELANLLLDRIKNPEKNVQATMIEYELMIRQSTVASAKTTWNMMYW